MGMKLNAAGLTARLGKRYAGLVNPGVSHVEVGVADASIAPYATYVEYGWVQRVTGEAVAFSEQCDRQARPPSRRREAQLSGGRHQAGHGARQSSQAFPARHDGRRGAEVARDGEEGSAQDAGQGKRRSPFSAGRPQMTSA